MSICVRLCACVPVHVLVCVCKSGGSLFEGDLTISSSKGGGGLKCVSRCGAYCENVIWVQVHGLAAH